MVGRQRVAPEALFVVGAVSQYIGASIAVELFDELTAGGVAWIRVLTAAVVVIIVRRSWRLDWTRRQLAWAGTFGVVLAFMNLTFYLAIDSLPLGSSVAIEFIGPIAVAAFGTRSIRNAVALGLTVGGILLLATVAPDISGRGLAFVLVAGTLWAGYIILGQRVALSGLSLDGLGVGMLVGSIAVVPFGTGAITGGADRPWLLLAAATTGVLSNAIPYAIDQVVLQRIDRTRFALLLALLPVTAVIIAFLVLGQRPAIGELAGIVLVIVAVAISRRPVPESAVEAVAD